MKTEFVIVAVVVLLVLGLAIGMWWHYYTQYAGLVQGMKDRDVDDRFDEIDRRIEDTESHVYRSMDSLEDKLEKASAQLNHRIDLIDAKHESRTRR